MAYHCRLKQRAGVNTYPSITEEALASGDHLDSNDILTHILLDRNVAPHTFKARKIKAALDAQLVVWCKEGWLKKTKNTMTDDNVSSSQSKYMYYLADQLVDYE